MIDEVKVMNEIRKNNDNEIKKIQIYFKVPFIAKFLVLLLIIFFGFIIFFGVIVYPDAKNNNDIDGQNVCLAFMIIGFLGLLATIMTMVLIKNIENSNCVITNKRIYGTLKRFEKKDFSYRLDEIENIETVKGIFKNIVIINFLQGYEPKGTIKYSNGLNTIQGGHILKFNFVKNIKEVYIVLSELLTAIKNNRDLLVDIEMSKVEVESKKVKAFENIAENLTVSSDAKSNISYLQELRDLKELMDAGIISKEEFDKKKKDILKI